MLAIIQGKSKENTRMTLERDCTQSFHDNLLYNIHNHNVSVKTREIYLHGNYSQDDDDPGIEFRMATTFIKNLQLLDSQNNDNILVYSHTAGGNWIDGMAIYNAIRFVKSPVTFVIYGQATSMSAIILQAADLRILASDCEFMIHHGSFGIEAESNAAYSAIEVNNRNCKRMLEVLAIRAIKSEYFKERDYTQNQIEKYIDKMIKLKGDWYLTPRKAVDYGFADGILGDTKYNSPDKLRYGKKRIIKPPK